MARPFDVFREGQRETVKRRSPNSAQGQPPVKKIKVLLDQDDGSVDEQNITSNVGENGRAKNSASPDQDGFSVNEDFARRFEHNKKREELQRR